MRGLSGIRDPDPIHLGSGSIGSDPDRIPIWSDFYKRMAWGGLRQLFKSAPPVAMYLQARHDIDVVHMAVRQAQAGEWALALNTVLELPQETAEAAARSIVAPIYAALSIPASVQVVMDCEKLEQAIRDVAASKGWLPPSMIH